jgi:hypothetical protein
MRRRGKNMGQTSGTLEVIREEDKNEIVQTYRIPLSTQSMYLTKCDCIEQQALQGDGILKCIRIVEQSFLNGLAMLEQYW